MSHIESESCSNSPQPATLRCNISKESLMTRAAQRGGRIKDLIVETLKEQETA